MLGRMCEKFKYVYAVCCILPFYLITKATGALDDTCHFQIQFHEFRLPTPVRRPGASCAGGGIITMADADSTLSQTCVLYDVFSTMVAVPS
jgi:hypothetical protein